eukprot:Plantae.Rhodophyta-Rhodochaete_pulchella.ctg7.p2 GENE.Plantae.Rhodophyta-Rhodochaete_pulchella.ctg7~~Plantae.Rhodophyta-Rhodochaete_pulchella.ctg7.p2  ORF type:complete len:226 (+),score=25.72 Plantae.Rhodophyta-Rhodochaete_pulchella.ctg7:1182-1859(+)
MIDSARGIDMLHLDTTYCNPRYKFPKQEDTVNAAVRAACEEVQRDPSGRILFVVGSYTIGKEKIFVSIAEALDLRIHAELRKRRILKLLDLPTSFLQRLCEKDSEAGIRVVGMGQINFDSLDKLISSGQFSRCVGFRPTGWSWKGSASTTSQATLDGGVVAPGIARSARGKSVIYSVAYSEHSSFTELQEFVSLCRAREILPTVGGGPGGRDTQLLRLLQTRDTG